MVFYESQKTLSTAHLMPAGSQTKVPVLPCAFKVAEEGGDLSFIKTVSPPITSVPPALYPAVDTKPITQIRKLPKLGYREVMSSGCLRVTILPAWTAGCVHSNEDVTKLNSDFCPMPPVMVLRRTIVT